MMIVFKYLKGFHVKGGTELFSVIPEGEETMYIKYREVSFDWALRKLIVRAVQQWNRLLQKVVDFHWKCLHRGRTSRTFTEK